MRHRLMLALLVCLVALPAGAADPSTVDTLTATAGSSGVNVTGAATFKDIAVQTGLDSSGDATAPGTDMTRSSISFAGGRVKFRVDLADPIAQLSSNPGAVTLWPITVNDTPASLNLHASRARVGTTPTTPHLRVVTISGGSITTVANVTGRMENGIIEWEVPLSTIGATPGSVITSDGALTTIPGISGVGTLNGNNLDDMTSDEPYTIPGATVKLGIGPTDVPAEEITLETPASVAANGSFTGKLPPQAAGTYQVVAQACFGPQSCSSLKSITITI